MKEILKDKDFNSQSKEVQNNLNVLLDKINKIRTLWGKPMVITNGLRTMDDNIRIYKEKAQKAGVPFDLSKVPTKNAHLSGSACDVFDPNKDLQKWCKNNEKELEKIGLWMEDFNSTPNWCHFQIYASKSGNRWFKP